MSKSWHTTITQCTLYYHLHVPSCFSALGDVGGSCAPNIRRGLTDFLRALHTRAVARGIPQAVTPPVFLLPMTVSLSSDVTQAIQLGRPPLPHGLHVHNHNIVRLNRVVCSQYTHNIIMVRVMLIILLNRSGIHQHKLAYVE